MLPVFDPPADVDFAQPFWDAAERGELALPRCSACRRWQWYPDNAGPDCTGAHLEWVTLAGTGKVHTWTRVHRSFLPDQTTGDPYTVVFVELDGAEGPRLVADLAPEETPRIGMEVRVRFDKVGRHHHPVFASR